MLTATSSQSSQCGTPVRRNLLQTSSGAYHSSLSIFVLAASFVIPILSKIQRAIQIPKSSKRPWGRLKVWLCRVVGGDATGAFSWRGAPAGTIQAHPIDAASPSPARGPWAKTSMARARLVGLSFGAPSPQQVPYKSCHWLKFGADMWALTTPSQLWKNAQRSISAAPNDNESVYVICTSIAEVISIWRTLLAKKL